MLQLLPSLETRLCLMPETLIAADAVCALLHYRLAGLPFWPCTDAAGVLHAAVFTLIQDFCICSICSRQ